MNFAKLKPYIIYGSQGDSKKKYNTEYNSQNPKNSLKRDHFDCEKPPSCCS